MGITKVIAEGKGKRIYATDNPDEAVVYFKDEAIAFRGLKIGRIIGKGEINNLLCEYIFTLLQKKGVPNHFLRRINDRSMLVLRSGHHSGRHQSTQHRRGQPGPSASAIPRAPTLKTP